jgi:hypothetical protein
MRTGPRHTAHLAKATILPHARCMRWSTAILLILGGAAACSSSTTPSGGPTLGTAKVDSTLTFMPSGYAGSAAASQADANHVSIVVASLRGTDSCSTVPMSAGASVANVFQVVVTMHTSNAANTVMSPGVYDLGDRWQASYKMTDAKCATAGQETATAGFLEIDSVDSSIHGIASMRFPTGRVIISFDAPLCDTAGVTGGGTACTSFPLCPAGQGTDLNPTPTETCVPFR